MEKQKEILIFKPYLKSSIEYKGGKTREEISAGDKKIYKLSSNENMLGSSPKALSAIRNNVHLIHEYPERTARRLQTALVPYYNDQLTASQFIIGNGASEILDLLIRGFLDQGLECIVSSPAFTIYQMLAEKQGAKVIDVPLIGSKFSLNIEGILSSVNNRTRLVFLTSPNNPTGTYISKNDIDLLISQLPDHVVVVFDEVYFHFVQVEDSTTALPYVLQGKRVVGVNSFSKAYGLAGLRVGYAYSTPEIINYLSQLLKPFLINKLNLEAAIAALDDTEFLTRTVNTVTEGKEFLYSELDKMNVKYWKSETNFIMIDPRMHPKEFEEKMMLEGVMIRPVSSLGAREYVRVTIGTRAANEAFIEAFKKILSIG